MKSRGEAPSRSSVVLCLGAAIAFAVLVGLLFQARAARREARERFFEQYNRQQLVVAVQAAKGIEGLFESFHRSLTLAARLLRDVSIAPGHAAPIGEQLTKVFEGIADAPVVELVVFDRRGTAVGITPWDRKTVGQDYSWREYYRWARDRGRPGDMYLSPFMKLAGGKTLGTKGLMAAEGLYGDKGEFRGVVGLVINFEEVARRHVLSIRLGEQGYAWLLDNNNRSILVDPRNRVSDLTFDAAFLPRWPKLYALAEDSAKARPGTDWYDFEDPADPAQTARKLVAYAPVRIGERLWTLGVCTPEREVETLVGSVLQRQTTLAGTAAAVTLFGAFSLLGLLLTWNYSLRREVAERTRDLGQATQKLESAFDELLSARKLTALGRLALGLAHEIRNPLFAIRMNMQMIRRKISPEGSVGESFEIVDQEVQRLNRLLNNVMGFAKPAAMSLVPTDLGALVAGVLQLERERLDAAGIVVETRLGGAPSVVCDPEQVRQVVLNLVLNAVEAMTEEPKPRRLVIELAAGPRKGTVELRISDTGPGVRPEDRDGVFDPFFTTKARGGGLGLSIAQTIVLRHGGTIEVEAREGQGACFVVRLAAAGPPSAGAQSTAEEVAA